MSILLQLQDITIQFQQRKILDKVNLQIEAGEVVTLVGPNGAGKTTLLRAALSLLPVSSGQVKRKDGLRIGYMPQRIKIDPSLPLSAKRFLTLAGTASDETLEKLIEEVGVGKTLNTPVQNLSGGEMQRLMMARALLHNPDLLVLDEPVQGVDIHGQSELYNLISAVRDRRGCAVLMVSHDLHMVMAATDRVVCVNGHICCAGTPESVTQNPAFIELFGPDVAQSIAIYTHDKKHRH